MPSTIATITNSRKRAIIRFLRSVERLSGGPAAAHRRRPGAPCRALTRERVVAEALAVISAEGVEARSMRALATRLGVVPGTLHRHVRSKEQLHDLILDGVLAEVDCRLDPSLPWSGQVTALARGVDRDILLGLPGARTRGNSVVFSRVESAQPGLDAARRIKN